ncbi:MAG TPA: DUF2203 domain-containing protein [Pirellulaceae bacterium]
MADRTAEVVMGSDEYKPERLFTIDQANATLPLVRAITGDLATLAKDVVERRHRLALLTSGRDLKLGDPYSDELAQMETDLERDAIRLQGYVDELRELGVEPKGAVEGLVDFPCQMDGKLVLLCWKLGEPEVLYWHDLDSGFGGRQPLTAGSVSGGYGHDDESYND